MPHSKNFRVYFLLALLLILAVVILLREHRPSILRPDLHLNAYISTSDGSLTVVDLASLRVINKIPVGPAISDLREHAKRPEIWGVSSAGGYVFVLNTRTSQIIAKIPVGASPLFQFIRVTKLSDSYNHPAMLLLFPPLPNLKFSSTINATCRTPRPSSVKKSPATASSKSSVAEAWASSTKSKTPTSAASLP